MPFVGWGEVTQMGCGDEVINYHFFPISVDVEVANSKSNLADVDGPNGLKTACEVVFHNLQDLNALGLARMPDSFIDPCDLFAHV